MAGFLSMDWNPYSLRELFLMYQGKLLEDWDQTASMVWAVKTVLGGNTTPWTYHPHRDEKDLPRSRKISVKRDNIGVLATAFLL